MKDVIVQFLDQKKEEFLQVKIKSELNKVKNKLPNAAIETEIQCKTREKYAEEANSKYNLSTWIENINKKAKPNVTTHPAKFTNAKIDIDTPQIFLGHYSQDGYLKTGNVLLKDKVDVSGNSATNTVIYELYELLDMNIGNNQTIVDKFKQDDPSLIELITQLNGNFKDIKSKCLNVYYGSENINQTHGCIRQVYFPVYDGYNLLSIKTASMLMYEVKNRIDQLNIWIEGKHIRDFKKNNKLCEITEFHEIYNITEIGFSNNDFIKMGNYSYLNVKNKGIAYLLSSVPPILKKRNIRLPNTNFFSQCLYRGKFKEKFTKLHNLMKLEISNLNIRNGIQNIICSIIDDILYVAFTIRKSDCGWSNTDYYSNLPKSQRIWLDDINQEERAIQIGWREEVSQEIARWLLKSYELSISDAILLSTTELIEVHKIVIDIMEHDKEFF